MPFVETRLISPTTLTTSASSALYTVPTGYSAIIKQLVVTNITGTAATFTFYIGAASAGNALFSGTSVAANDTVIINLSQVLTTGETLRALASTGSALNLTVSGVLNDGPLASTATYIPDNAITSAKIADGAIVNADINASAAIAVSKLANATAGQLLIGTTTTGVITPTTISGDVTVTGAGVTAIKSDVSLNGAPTAPTATAGTNTTQLATTAFANTAGGTIRVGGGSFTNVASFDVTGFSSSYDFYQLIMLIGGASAVVGLTAQLFEGGTVRNATYYGQQFLAVYTGTTGVFNTRSAGTTFAFPDCAVSPKTLINATISGIGNGQFNMSHTAMDNANVGSWFGGYSNYAATNSFDRIRITGNGNISGAYQLLGVKKL
jgi:hypothetical protein